jgi:hypothetical protein
MVWAAGHLDGILKGGARDAPAHGLGAAWRDGF